MVKKMAGKVVQRVGIKGDDLEQEDEAENTVISNALSDNLPMVYLLLACN